MLGILLFLGSWLELVVCWNAGALYEDRGEWIGWAEVEDVLRRTDPIRGHEHAFCDTK